MRKIIAPLLLLILLAACGGPASQSEVTDKKDSITTARDSSTPAAVPHAREIGRSGNYIDWKGITGLPAALTTWVPAGFQVKDTLSGNLNLDSLTDWLLVLSRPGEDTLTESQYAVDGQVKRKLLILTGQPDNSYKLAAESDNAVYCAQCGGMLGDPYQQLAIKQGYFSVEHYGGSRLRWTHIITFKYDRADSTWYLYKDGHQGFEILEDGTEKKTSEKVRTAKDFGKLSFAEYDIYKD